MIKIIGPQYVSSFIAEPLVGSTVGAITPPDEYWPMIRDICSRYDVILISDEVMTGCGRTGKNFAVDHWNVVPDIIATAKGLAAGYVPTGGIIARTHLVEAIKNGSGSFMHGHTYNGNPISAAAVCAVFKYMKEHGLVENAAKMGEMLGAGLKKIAAENPIVGDVRGKGLMWGFELVKDKSTKEPFEKTGAANVATKECVDRGLIIYPGSGQVEGLLGDNFLVAPPLIINEAQVGELLEKLAAGLDAAAETCRFLPCRFAGMRNNARNNTSFKEVCFYEEEEHYRAWYHRSHAFCRYRLRHDVYNDRFGRSREHITRSEGDGRTSH